ncbi:MAG: Rieske 2Fe-2S domain-containing protein [Cyanobacteria bacterium J06635_1]
MTTLTMRDKPTLPGAPWLIAHRSLLNLHQPYKLTLNGQDYVLWQDAQGEIFALGNVCPHQQAPLSNGWICPEYNIIVCPFHTVAFNGNGQRCRDGKPEGQPLINTLELSIQGDFIWTYGGHEPKLPIPDLHRQISAEYEFVGVAISRSIQGDFLSNVLINYDYNHQNGTHRDVLRIKNNHVSHFEKAGYHATVIQGLERADNSWKELFSNPALLLLPKKYEIHLEYEFPSTTIVRTSLPTGKLVQMHLLYPESGDRTRSIVLVFAQYKYNVLKAFNNSILKGVALVVEQDAEAIETSYPRQKPKIRLPNEEILTYAEDLYRHWEDA